jgi:5'-nucleotidase
MDIPSIAISVTSHTTTNFNFAAKVAKTLAKEIAGKDLPLGTLLNINVPDVPEEEIAGILLTRQGKSKWDDMYEQRKDPYGREYFWLTGILKEVDTEIETDQAAIKKNYVSVTPIHFDLTDYKTFDMMKEWKIERLFNGKKT